MRKSANRHRRRAAAAVALALISASAAGVRIKDIARVYGPMENPLVGMGLVVGLAGTGDDAKFAPSIKLLSNMLTRLGAEALPTEVLASKNVALVSISATLDKYSKAGDRLRVDVAAVGNAKSLEGGILVLSPLMAPQPGDQKLVMYATAQGVLKADRYNPTTALIEDGAIVVSEVPAVLTPEGKVVFKLSDDNADFLVATRIVEVIHEDLNIDTTSVELGGKGDQPVARAVDAATIEVSLTEQQAADPVPFISHIERLPVPGLSTAMEARVVIDEKNSFFYAINGNVEISPVMVGHGNLQVEIKADRDDEATTLDDLVTALKRLEAPPADVIGLLKALEAAGALHAKVIRK